MTNTSVTNGPAESPDAFELKNISILMTEPDVQAGPDSSVLTKIHNEVRESIRRFADRCYLNTDEVTKIEEYMPARPLGDEGVIYTFLVPIEEKFVPSVEVGIIPHCRIFREKDEITKWDEGRAESAQAIVDRLCPDFRYSPKDGPSPMAWLVVGGPQGPNPEVKIEVFGGIGGDGFAVIDLARNEAKVYDSDKAYYNGRKAPVFTRSIGDADFAIIKEFANCIESAVTDFCAKKGWK